MNRVEYQTANNAADSKEYDHQVPTHNQYSMKQKQYK